jgi:hypothetical protein
MPDCVTASVAANVEAEDVSQSLVALCKSTVPDRVLRIKESRRKAFISLQVALRDKEIRIKAIQGELDNAKSAAQEEKAAKDIAIAEIVNLRDRVARLEKAAKRLSQQAEREEILAINESMQQNISHEIAMQTIIKSNPNSACKDGTPTRRRHFTSTRQPLPLRTAATTVGSYATRGPTSQGSSGGDPKGEAPQTTTIYAGDGRSTIISRCWSESGTTEGPHHIRELKKKMSSIFRPHREGKYNVTPPVGTDAIRKQWEAVHNDLRRMPTMDSGYASFGHGETPTTSEAGGRRCEEL